MRNHANDFVKAPGLCIRTAVMADYAKHCQLGPDDKRALHNALVTHLGAKLERKEFWTPHGAVVEPAYVDIFWNLDTGFPDFEQFHAASDAVRQYMPPICNTGAPQ
jgi:hypothetical protein